MSKNNFDVYHSPLVSRNASPEMSELFSQRRRILIWRQLWVALAEAERELGLNISERQIGQLKRAFGNIDFRKAAKYEERSRHEVMAHVHAFGDDAPAAKGILHLGAASAFVMDNGDLIVMREAMQLIRDWLVNIIDALGRFALEHKKRPTLGLTHYQPAQLTTVGKRAAMWCYDFILDLERLEFEIRNLKFRGVKGTTGTQASFLELFGGNKTKVRKLEKLVARKVGFDHCYPVVGQTYPRKVDAHVVSVLGGIAGSGHKLANDLRLLANLQEMEEPFQKKQIGSSSMAYKRNPMRCERATGLARFVLSLVSSPLQTAAEQWFERTLDDSANRRLSIPEAFLASDGMLMIMVNVIRGLVIYPRVIQEHVEKELPFMATENILMAAVKAGGDRQQLHEHIRRHARAAAEKIKQQGGTNDLLARLKSDSLFDKVDFKKILKPENFIGLAEQQTESFVKQYVEPIRRKYSGALRKSVPLKV